MRSQFVNLMRRMADSMAEGRGYFRTGLILALVIFVLDQLSKYWVVHLFWPGQGCQPLEKAIAYKCHYTVTPFMDLTMAWNTGISYGLLSDYGVTGRVLLIAFSLVAIIGFSIWLMRAQSLLLALSIGLVIGGAAGNAVDRVLYEAVADFVSLHAFGFYWYIFNLADVAIVAGAVGLLYDMVWGDRKKALNTQ